MIDEKNPFSIQGQSDDQSWALEETQSEMLDHIKEYVTKNAHKDTAALRKIAVNTSKSGEKEVDILKDLDDEAKKANQTRNKNLTGMSKSINKGNDMARTDALATLKGMRANSAGHLKALSGKGGGFIKTIGTFDGDVGKMSETIAGAAPLIGGALGASVGTILSINKTWQGLSNVGQSFGNDMFEMRTQLLESGLGFEGATKYLTEFSDITSSVGAKSMLDLQKNVRAVSSEFGNYGMTIEQVGSISASLLKQDMSTGAFKHLDEAKRAARTNEYMKTLKVLANLTGRQVEEIDRENRARSESVTIEQSHMMALQNGMSEVDWDANMDAVDAAVATLDPAIREQVAEIMALDIAGGVQTSDMGNDLKALNSDLFKATRMLHEARNDEERKLAAAALKAASINMGANNKELQAMGMYITGSMKTTIDAMTKQEIHTRKLATDKLRTAEEVLAAEEQIKKDLMNKEGPTIGLNKRLNDLANVTGETMAKFSDGLKSMTTNFLAEVDKWVAWGKRIFDALGISIDGVIGKINAVLGGWGKWAITISAGVVAALGLWGAFKLVRMGMFAFSGGLGKLFAKMKGLGKAGKAGSALKQAKAAKAAKALKTTKAGKLGALGQKAGTGLKIAGKAGVGLGVALVAGGIVKDLADIAGSVKKGERVKSEDKYAAGGATTGAVIGGVIGLVGGPLGAAIGAGIGGWVGDVVGTKIGKAKDAKHAATVAAAAPAEPIPEVSPDVNVETIRKNKQQEAIDKKNKEAADRLKAAKQKTADMTMKARSGDTVAMDDTRLLQEIQKSSAETNMLLRFIVDSSGQTAISAKRNEQDLLKGNDSV